MPEELAIVNPVSVDDVPDWIASLASVFLQEPESSETADLAANIARGWVPERSWGVRDRDRWVATLATLDRTITVPGADGATAVVRADALTGVTVRPTHRRRGLLTRMIERSLRAAKERGDALSILIAAEWPIYGRFGYAPAAWDTDRVLHRSRRGSEIDGDVSRVRQVDREEYAAIAPAVFAAHRRLRPGQVDRDDPWWPRSLACDGYRASGALPHNFIVHDGDDGPDGILAWTTTREGEGGLIPPRAAVKVDGGPFAATDAAHRDLWAYLSGLDLVDEVAVVTASDDPVVWLLRDARTLITTRSHDSLWLRLLDVPAALAARRYAVAGELVLEVTDPTPYGVAGRYRLASDGTAAQPECEPTTAPPDLTVAQTALSSAYLGGITLRAQRPAGTVTEHRRGALQLADAMFGSPLAPFNATGF